jgi:cytidylate kinase
MDSKTVVITLDGTAGSGKSTVAREAARRLGYAYLDSGALYRSLTWAALRRGVDLDSEEKLAGLFDTLSWSLQDESEGMAVFLDGEPVGSRIRREEVTSQVRRIARWPAVRRRINRLQRDFVIDKEGVVVEGRDIGTAVFPQAPFKFYLTASLEERAHRRRGETKGEAPSIKEVQVSLAGRDEADATRVHDPLRVPDGAVVIDTTSLTAEEVVECVIGHIRRSK